MKHYISFFISFFFLANAAFTITPITGFNEGDYAGQADWLAQDGSSGTFNTFLDMESSSWTIAMFEVGEMLIYRTRVVIDSEGFLTAEMIDETDPHNPIYYPGYGNCGTNYCQMTIYLYNGNLWKALVFNGDDTISLLGAINFDDGSPNVQWEGSAFFLPGQ